jgi:DNA transformation protein
MLRKHIQRLEDLPNIGKSIAHDLRGIGIAYPDDLLQAEPLAVFNQLAEVMGQRHDPCVLYTLIAVHHYLHGAEPQLWWKYTVEGKKLLSTSRL